MPNVAPFGLLILLFLVVGLCVVIFYHTVRRRGTGGWLSLAFGSLFIIIIVGMVFLSYFFLRPQFQEESQASGVRLPPQSALSSPSSPQPRVRDTDSFLSEHIARSSQWADLNLEDQQFLANNYPNLDATVRPLASMVRDTLNANQLVPQDGDGQMALTIVRVTGQELPHDSSHDNSIVQVFGEQIREEFPGCQLIVFDDRKGQATAAELTESTVVISLSVEAENETIAPWDRTAKQRSGRLCCEITTLTGSAKASIAYIEKPWVEAYGMFVSLQPKRHFVVGYSGRLASSEAEARRMAVANAEQQFRVDHGGSLLIPQESLVIDRFAQKLSRPYGDVWREAVLLDVSADRIAVLTHANQLAATDHQRRQFPRAVALVLLFILATALCVSLNLLTHGYYRERLALGCAAALGMVLLGLLFIG